MAYGDRLYRGGELAPDVGGVGLVGFAGRDCGGQIVVPDPPEVPAGGASGAAMVWTLLHPLIKHERVPGRGQRGALRTRSARP